MDKKGSWRPQEAEEVPTETFWTMLGPKLKSRGAQNRPLDRRKSAKRLHKGRYPERLAASKNRPGRDLCSKQVPGIILIDFGSLEQKSSVRNLENVDEGDRCFIDLGTIIRPWPSGMRGAIE